MKKIVLTSFFAVFSIFSFAQSNFDNQIKENAIKLNSADSVEEFDAVFSVFSTLTKTNDQNKWKAYYYAGLTQYKKAELFIKLNDFANANNTNDLAYKYIKGSMYHANNQNEPTKLKELIEIQKTIISKKLNNNTPLK